MNVIYPIYTEKTECQDCYKCVRVCPFKAIKIENGRALIIPEKCVYCGKCVEVCPPEAKKVRNDRSRIELLFSLGKNVIISLAPSFIAEFDCKPGQLAAGLKILGFTGVSETALGAEIISSDMVKNPEDKRIIITSSCPTIVEIVKKYSPDSLKYLSEKISPVLAHCLMLKEKFGEDTHIVFAGPCISKKFESDSNPDLLPIAITFKGLKEWFKSKEINLHELEESDFITERSNLGTIYPIDGGFIETVKRKNSNNNRVFMSFSGIQTILNILTGLDKIPDDGNTYYIEALACEGGCINGPMTLKSDNSILHKRLKIMNAIKNNSMIEKENISTVKKWETLNVEIKTHSPYEVTKTLHVLGKFSQNDELNCGGCGYDSCRDLAIAVLNNFAEMQMCVAHNRRLAQKKANALIKTIPSAVVIINSSLKVIECNLNFAKMFIDEASLLYEIKPGLEGASIEKTLPGNIVDYFITVLQTGQDTLERDIKVNGHFIHFTIFSIEPKSIVGAVFQDITSPMIQKKNIIERAENVINKNLKTVQKIANLLGENAADTEMILNSIIDSFAVEGIEENNYD